MYKMCKKKKKMKKNVFKPLTSSRVTSSDRRNHRGLFTKKNKNKINHILTQLNPTFLCFQVTDS